MRTDNRRVEEHFDEVIGSVPEQEYSFNAKRMGHKDRRIIEALTNYEVAGKTCLDIGPGTGRWLTFLKKEGAAYLAAADISNVVLKRAAPLSDKIQKLDLEKEPLDFEDCRFDIILSIEVLEHLRDPDLYLSEIIRVAKPGAGVIMSVPNVASLTGRLRLLAGFLPAAIAADRTHVAFYRARDLSQLLSGYDQTIKFLPTSISLSMRNTKSRFRIPSTQFLTSLNDSLLFTFTVNK